MGHVDNLYKVNQGLFDLAKLIRRIWRPEGAMLGLAITFLIIALVAALLGLTGIAVLSVEIARLLFIIFLVLFVISLIFGIRMRRRPPPLWFSKMVAINRTWRFGSDEWSLICLVAFGPHQHLGSKPHFYWKRRQRHCGQGAEHTFNLRFRDYLLIGISVTS